MGKKKTKPTKKQDGADRFAVSGVRRGATRVEVTDKHHNMDTPCSSLVRNVVLDIFPCVADAEKEEGRSAEAKSERNDQFDRLIEVLQRSQKTGKDLDWGDDNVIDGVSNRKNGKGKETNGKEAGGGNEIGNEQEKKEQPLFGYMIHHYLVQQRKRAREQQSCAVPEENEASKQLIQRDGRKSPKANGTVNRNEVNEDSTMVDDNSNTQEANSASAAIKKKKKKKRKKKTNESADAQDEGPDAEGEALQNNMKGKTDVPLGSGEKINRENPIYSNSLKCRGKEGTQRVSSFDRFLDTIIDSPTNDDRRPHRDIESFANYLHQKYQSFLAKQQAQKKDKKSKQQQSSSNDNSAKLMTFLPTVSLDELTTMSSHIECRTCRTSVTSNLRAMTNNLSCHTTWVGSGCHFGNGDFDQPDRVPFFLAESTIEKKKGPRQLDVSVPISGDEERAFDYVAMEDDLDLEAGHSAGKDGERVSNAHRFRLEFHSVQIGEQNYLQIKPMSEGKKGSIYPLSSDEIVNLIKYVILPCGLEQYEWDPEAQRLSDDDFESLMLSARKACGEHRKKFYEINNLISQMTEQLQSAAATNNRSQFDSSTTTALHKCDDFCETVLKFIGNFLIRITQDTCRVGLLRQYGPHLMECMESCWDEFNVTLDKLIMPTMMFRGGVLRYSNHPGQVPATWGSKMIRDEFYRYMLSKVAMVEKLVSHLDLELIDPTYKSYHGTMHQAPSPLARVCILKEYLSFLSMSQDSSSRIDLNLFPSEDDESKFTELIFARIKLSQTGIRSIRIDTIRAQERQNYAHVSELYSSICENAIPKLVSQAQGPAPDFIKQYYDRYALERLKAQRDLRSNPGEITPEIAASLLNSSRLLTMQWLYLLCLRQSNTPVDFVVPSRLDDWMESLSGSDINPIERYRFGPFKCDGSGGKRRVSGVLAALLYRWLEVRCSEWHAELTQDELLKSVDIEEPAVKEGAIKSGKKKKSMKKKVGTEDNSKVEQPILNESLSYLIKSSSNDEHMEKTGDVPSAVNDVETNEADLQLNGSRVVGVKSSDPAEDSRNNVGAVFTTTSIDDTKANNSKLALITSDIEQLAKQHVQSKLSVSIDDNVQPASADVVKSGKKKKIKKKVANADKSIEVKKDKADDPPTELNDSNGTEPLEKANSVQPAVADIDFSKSAEKTSKDSRILSLRTVAACTYDKAVSISPGAVKMKEGKPTKPHQTKPESTENTSVKCTIFAKSQALSQQKPKQTAKSTSISLDVDGINTTEQSNAKPINQDKTKSKSVKNLKKPTAASESVLPSLEVPRDAIESNLAPAYDVVEADLKPRVGVVDNGKVISAEDFLVGRMEELLAEINASYNMWI